MNIHEYQAKALLRSYGIPVSDGRPVMRAEEAKTAAGELDGPLWVVKAQIHAGGRGKGKFKEPEAGEKGGVRLARSVGEAAEFARQMLGRTLVTVQTGPAGKVVNRIYIEDGSDIAHELYIAMLIGFCVPMYNIGAVWPMARHAKRHFGRELLRNPLIIATSSGLLANVLGFSLPVWAEPTVKTIAAASLPLGLMAAGAGLQLGSLFKAKLLAVCILTIRHFLTPLIALGLSYAFGLSPVQTTILLAFSALPTASSAYVLASRMGYDGAYVASLVTVSTLLGMVSLPFALSLR